MNSNGIVPGISWNRRRVIAAGLVAGLVVGRLFQCRRELHDTYSLSVIAHPDSPLPEAVSFQVAGPCGVGHQLQLAAGSRGKVKTLRLCPHCVQAGFEVRFRGRRRRFFYATGADQFVLRGTAESLPFVDLGAGRRNLNVTIANYRHPELLDLRVDGRCLRPV